jgi:hypothetical protein
VAHIYHCASRPKPIGTVEEQYTVQDVLLVRQYDQPSYDNEELVVDYAFEVLSVKKKGIQIAQNFRYIKGTQMVR